MNQINTRLLILIMALTMAGCVPRSGTQQTSTQGRVGAPVGSQSSSLSSSQPSRVSADPRTDSDLVTVNSLLLLPPALMARARPDQISSETLTEGLEASARQQLDMRLVGQEALKRQSQAITSSDRYEALALVGRTLGADSFLVTQLNTYRERSGSGIGGDPSSVNFTMSVVRISDLKTLWSANYHFRDQALSENLFRLPERLDRSGEGAGWKRAADLLRNGFNETLKDLAMRRLEAFGAK